MTPDNWLLQLAAEWHATVAADTCGGGQHREPMRGWDTINEGDDHESGLD